MRQHHAGIRRPAQPDRVVRSRSRLGGRVARSATAALHRATRRRAAPCRSTCRRDSRCRDTCRQARCRSPARRSRRRCASSPAAARADTRRPARRVAGARRATAPRRALDRDAVGRRDAALDQVDVADEIGDPARIRAARRSRPAAPTWASRPWSITAMRSATVIASSWSWVTMTKVVPSLRCSSISSNWVSARSFLSSAASGSSSSSTVGRLTSERASATRWRWPPDSWSRLAARRNLRAAPAPASPRRARRSRPRGTPSCLQPERDVARDRQMRKQRVALEHHVDRPPVRRHGGDVVAVEQDAARRRRLEAGEHAQQRGLAAARRPEQREEFAVRDVERKPLDRGQRAEALGRPPRSAPAAGSVARLVRQFVPTPRPRRATLAARGAGTLNAARSAAISLSSASACGARRPASRPICARASPRPFAARSGGRAASCAANPSRSGHRPAARPAR